MDGSNALGYQRRARQWELLLKRARHAKNPDEQEALLLAVLVLARDVVVAVRREIESSDQTAERTKRCNELLRQNRKPWLFLKYARNLFVHARPPHTTPMTTHSSFMVSLDKIVGQLDVSQLLKHAETVATREYVGFSWDGVANLDRRPTAEEAERLEHFLDICQYDLLMAVELTSSFASELVRQWNATATSA